MKTIVLTNSDMLVWVDDEDHEYLSQFTWSATRGGHAQARIKGKKVLMHRVIMNAIDTEEIDHEDLDKKNNQKYNLRRCTKSQNKANTDKPTNNTSGYKGVCWHRRMKKWQAGIKFNQKNIHLGYFDDPRDAALAYNDAAISLFGKFARPNVVRI